MSLTSFLRTNRDVRRTFSRAFNIPRLNPKPNLLAPPLTNHYSLVGTAFDYLLRWYIERIYPRSKSGEWIAEIPLPLLSKKLLKYQEKVVAEARKVHAKYLKTGDLNEKVLESCLLLGQWDPIFRAGYVDPDLGKIDPKDIQDLKNLIELVNPAVFRAEKLCILNPTFGKASELIGGADVDLVLDETIIDFKTTMHLRDFRKYAYQLIGYYLLFLIGGIDGAPRKTNMDFLGIYYSRQGLLYKISVKEMIGKCNMKKITKWFKMRIKGNPKAEKMLEEINPHWAGEETDVRLGSWIFVRGDEEIIF